MTKKAPPPAHVRTQEETIQELREQVRALRLLSWLFSRGETWAGKPIATTIYVICHDGVGKSRSLLSQLGIRDELNCITTALAQVSGNILTLPLLLGFQFGRPDGVVHIPRFTMYDYNKFERIPFEEWWSQPAYSQGETNIITRKELVLAVRSKDGGSHFDAELACENYVKMRSEGGWQKQSVEGEDMPPDPTHLISMFAMAWELYHSLLEYDQQQQSPPEGI